LAHQVSRDRFETIRHGSLQELLQGISGPRASKAILEQFTVLPFLMPDRQDHIDAAELRK
jgi:hypothetical protein